MDFLVQQGWRLAIETNGSIELPSGFAWVTVSPKVAEHLICQKVADEVKYVRGYGQTLPETVVRSDHKLVSPVFNGSEIDEAALEWCIGLVKENPEWRLSPQYHKLWKIR